VLSAANQIENGLEVNHTPQTLLASQFPNSALKIGEEIEQAQYLLKENVGICRVATVEAEGHNGIVSSYVHNEIMPGVGEKAAVLSLSSTDIKPSVLETLGESVGMHIVCSVPLVVRRSELSNEMTTKHMDLFREEARSNGKEGPIAEKIAIGKMNKFCKEVTLLEQEWMLDDSKRTVTQVLEGAGKVTIHNFHYFCVGR